MFHVLEMSALVTVTFRTAEMWYWDLSMTCIPRDHLLAGLCIFSALVGPYMLVSLLIT